MLEMIEIDGNIKLMALIICGIKYGDNYYVIYSVKRDNNDDNIFVSKIDMNSEGYVINDNFSGGEKEAIEGVVTDIFNKDSVQELNKDKVVIIPNLKLDGVNKFSMSKCYVTTIKRELIKEVMVHYGLLDVNEKKAIVKEKDMSYFSKGSVSSIFLIVLGIGILILCISVIAGVVMK